MHQLLILASEAEAVPPDHIAAKIAVPIGILVFCGSIYLLLWAIYGAKKGALVYGTAFFGFATMLGIFWWFGAPGTPVATGLQNFPGQTPDNYQGKWFAFEPGSERADFFPASNSFDNFATPAQYVGMEGVPEEELEGDPAYAFIVGDLAQAGDLMLSQWLPTDQQGSQIIGAERRQALQEAAGEPRQGEVRGDPFYTAEVQELRVTDDAGHRVAAARIATFANYADAESGQATRTVEVEQGTWYAFKDPGAIWFPSAVWTAIALVLFLACLLGLDRLERREREAAAEVQEAEDVKVPVVR